MNKNKLSQVRKLILIVGLLMIVPFVSPETCALYAQIGNSISGHVFGSQRQPITDVNVELLDDLSRTINRSRTNGSGRYAFYGMPSGRYKIRVLTYATEYEEQEQEIEITNFSVGTSSGGSRISGFSSEQRDFYLRMKKGATTETTGTIFAQEVPDQAKKLYEKALSDLSDKKEKEAFESLKSALDVYPKYYAALEKLGTEYVRLKYFDAAQILLTVAVDVNPRGFRSWYGLAYSQYSLGKSAQALTSVQKAVELSPNSIDALLLSGVVMKQNKRFEEAEKQLVRAREVSNGNAPEIHKQLGLLYGYDLKRYREAVKELKLYLKSNPNARDTDNIKNLIKEFEQKAQTT